jgi:hypothetical protein
MYPSILPQLVRDGRLISGGLYDTEKKPGRMGAGFGTLEGQWKIHNGILQGDWSLPLGLAILAE